MPVAFIDFETPVDRDHNLKKMSLPSYLEWVNAQGGPDLLALALDDGEPQVFGRGDFPLDDLTALSLDPTFIVAAHNAAFDIRVWRHCLNLPQPQIVRCTLEMAHAAYPNHPGGYGLANLSLWFGLPPKHTIDLLDPSSYTKEQYEAYVAHDTVLCRGVYRRCEPRIHPREMRVGELANQVRELEFEVQAGKVQEAIEGFSEAALEAAVRAIEYVGRDGATGFGYDGVVSSDGNGGSDAIAALKAGRARVRSVRTQKMKDLLVENLGFDTQTISVKKLNPARLAANPAAATAIHEVSRVNKALSHHRRVKVFAGSPRVFMELGWHRAHTGRYSSPAVGRGLNLHNMAKHDKAVAKPFRSMFRLPAGYCFVRADLANVEYRIEGLLTGCSYTDRLFSENPLADPYSEFGYSATGLKCNKKDPVRQVYKESVLGLGFLMGLQTFVMSLLKAMANSQTNKDPKAHVTVQVLDDVCKAKGWIPLKKSYQRSIQTKTGAPWQVVTVAYEMREAFHRIHPEFRLCAEWLEKVVSMVSAAIGYDRQMKAIDLAYQISTAPDRNLIDLTIDKGMEDHSVRAKLGHWPAYTIAWRDIGVRETPYGLGLTAVQAGNKGYRSLTKNALIENVTQACARNAITEMKMQLEKEWPYLLSVHDEILVVCPMELAAVRKAKADLLELVGPGAGGVGYGNAIIVKPGDVGLSRSMWEDEDLNAGLWDRVTVGDESVFNDLP